MHSNDNHLRVIDLKQQYERFYFTLTQPKKDSVLELAWIVVWRGEDKEPPSAPVQQPMADDGKREMKWDASRDNLMVRGYQIFRNSGTTQKPDWKLVTFCTGTSCANLEDGEYDIRAVDLAGNVSAPSVFRLGR